MFVHYLLESFNVIKNKWSTKCEVLALCIQKMAKFDICIAMEMWLYLLKKNNKYLKLEGDSEMLVSEMINMMILQIMELDDLKCKGEDEILFDIIVPEIINKEELIDYIYGKTYCAGSRKYDCFETAKKCFAYILIKGSPQVVKRMVNNLFTNRHMKLLTMGDYLLEVVEYVTNIFQDKEHFIQYNSLDNNVYNTLLKEIENIKNPIEKAECKIAIASMVQ